MEHPTEMAIIMSYPRRRKSAERRVHPDRRRIFIPVAIERRTGLDRRLNTWFPA